MSTTAEKLKIVGVDVQDIRFPTSLYAHGSDAMHTDPDYSAVYVTIKLRNGMEGNGMTFTLGRGNEIVVAAVESLKDIVLGQVVTDIYKDFGNFWRALTSDSQLRWVGPEKGVIHLATAAIVNGLWDLWAKLLKKPLWRLLVDLEPEQLVSCIDFRYLSNVLTKNEAIEILRRGREGMESRIEELEANGYPAYTTQAGWIGFNDQQINDAAAKYLALGFTAFKVKVGRNLYEDVKRLEKIRALIGWDKTLMVDANQIWEVQEAIDWMTQLAVYKPLWIEEPTSPDDVLGHATIASALKPLGIAVATGEMCCNRVLFKQFLQTGAMEYCQIDSARIGGVNEILSVYLMARKMKVKVCPHAGGVGLCEMVQHLQMWDYVALSGTKEGRMIEYVDEHHEHFENPLVMRDACYIPPKAPGYSSTLKQESVLKYSYPNGSEWLEMFQKGLFPRAKK
ncbi:mitochondrial enolase superfamily member 1-like [Coccinella septempunctata]|uniref:mitochondrial enolase superfamily member 1-like n=1 Tax=Coccinella septempunctata TaxID=41139 RepID=UPI001D08C79F|nr:mitochondrial enolase superfamily member 1-like [Coccinella septempunctata]